jgi:RNA polymerase sigma-70 factor (ECF subfamily)
MSQRAASAQRIVETLQQGRSTEESFRHLCDLYSRALCHFFARRGFSHEDCCELTQETFLGIYKGIGSFRREAGFETWLFKIATNAYRKRLRWGAAEKRAGEEVPLTEHGDDSEGHAGTTPAEPVAGGPAPGEGLLQRERSRLVREAIEKLPEQMRKCLILRVYHDLKYREIGTVMRLSPETVKVHLFQARRRLQRDLGDYFGDWTATADEAAS